MCVLYDGAPTLVSVLLMINEFVVVIDGVVVARKIKTQTFSFFQHGKLNKQSY